MDGPSTSTPVKAAGKLEALPKEELLKFIKKQALNSKELKKKIEELTHESKQRKDDLDSLEKEKRDWISRGVSAEFEKKDKIVKKNKELELAALLGKEMLAENDDLQKELEELKQEHDDTIQDFEEELEKALKDKEVLEETLNTIHEEYKTAKLEAEECRFALQNASDVHEKNLASLTQENKDFRTKVQDLEHQLNTSAVNLKLHKLKDKYDELSKENKQQKDAKVLADEDLRKKSEHIVSQDQEINTLRKDIADFQRQKRTDQFELESLQQHNNELMENLEEANQKNQILTDQLDAVVNDRNEKSFYMKELDEELQRVKAEKEKQSKAYKNTKTKLERAVQMEEELKKQLSTIVGERDDLLKRLQKKGQIATKSKSKKSPRESDLEKTVAEKDKLLKDLEGHIAELERENSDLQKSAQNFSDGNSEIHERYMNIQKDFDNLSFEIDELTSKTNVLREEKNKLIEKNNELTQQNNTLQTMHDGLISEKDDWLVQRSTLEAQIENLKSNIKKSPSAKTSSGGRLSDEKKKTQKGKGSKVPVKKDASPNKTTSTTTTTRPNKTDEKDEKEKTDNQLAEQLEETKATIVKLEGRINDLLLQLQTLNEEKHNQDTELEELFKSHDDLQNKYDFECQERQENGTFQDVDVKVQKKENEISYLEVKLSELTKDTEEKASDDLTEQISQLRETLNEEQQRNTHFQQEIQVKEEYIAQLQHEIDNLQRKQVETNTANNKEVDNIVHEFEQLDQQIVNTKGELARSRIEIERLTQQLSKATEELENSKKEFADSNKGLEDSKSELENLNKELENSRLELTNSRKVFENLQTELDNTKNEYDQLNISFTAVSDELNNTRQEVTNLTNKLASIETESSKTIDNLAVTEKELSELKSNDEEQKIIIDSLKEEVKKLSCNDVSSLVEQSSTKEEISTQQVLDNQITELQLNIKELEEKLFHQETIQKDNHALQEENQMLQSKIQTLSDESDTLRHEMRSLSTDLQTFDNEYRRVSEEHENLKETYERVINLKADVQTQLNETKDKLECAENETKTLKAALEIYENLRQEVHCQNSVDEFKEYVCSMESMKLKLDEFTTENEKIKNDNTDLLLEKESVLLHRNELQEKFNETSTQLTSLKEQFENEMLNRHQIESELNNTREELTSLKNDESLAVTENKLSETEAHTQTIPLVENDIDIDELQNELSEKDSIISKLQTSLDALNVQITEQKEKQETRVNTQSQLHEEILIEKDADISQLQDENHKLKELLNDAHAQTNNLKLMEENYTNEIHEKQSQIELLTNQITEKQLRVDELTNEIKELKMKEESLTREQLNLSDASNSQLIELQETLRTSEELNKNLKHEIEEYHEQIASLENENKLLTDDLNHHVHQGEKLQNIINEKVEMLDTLKKTINEQTDKNSTALHEYEQQHAVMEEELQSALNRIDELENETKESKDENPKVAVLEARLKENTEKASKFRSVAIKAKKELESLRAKQEQDKSAYDDQLEDLMNQSREMKSDLVRQKTECGKHEEEFEIMQNEIKTLQDQVTQHVKEKENAQQKIEQLLLQNTKQENLHEESSQTVNEKTKEIENLMRELNEAKSALLSVEEKLKAKIVECEQLNKTTDDLQTTLNSKQKETQKVTMMNLEIDDYHRTIDNLQQKVDTQKALLEQHENTIEKHKTTLEDINQKNTTLLKEKKELEDKSKKFKTLIVKLKKEIAELNNRDSESRQQFEDVQGNNDEMKIQLSELTNEHETLKRQLKNKSEQHEKAYQALEVKHARVTSDLTATRKSLVELQSEYEHYKVRAQNVLKQQKEQKIDSEKEIDNIERNRLEDVNNQLKQKLSETAKKLNALQCDHGELELEHERLLTRHNQFVREITEKEDGWKQRFENLRTEKTTKILELEDKVDLLTKENSVLLKSAKEHSDLKKSDEEEHLKEIKTLKEELSNLKKQQQGDEAISHRSQPPKHLELHKQDSVEYKRRDSINFFQKIERQEGEGMDQKELELIDTLSQRSEEGMFQNAGVKVQSAPPTPLSPTNAAVLEKLLSAGSESHLASPQTPGSMRDELLSLRSSLNTSLKKNEHLTALLRDSEANISRLDDQAKVLKEEIRRLERNEQREQALSNMEYLKNVIIQEEGTSQNVDVKNQFLKVGHTERQQLIPVLNTMLKLSNDEKQFLCDYAKGDNAGEEDVQNGTWSSYVYRWTSLS